MIYKTPPHTIEEIQAAIEYNPETGEMTRRGKARSISGACRKNKTLMLDGKIISRSTVAYVLTFGKFPEGNIFHVNGDNLDFRLANLTRTSPLRGKPGITHSEETKKRIGILNRKPKPRKKLAHF